MSSESSMPQGIELANFLRKTAKEKQAPVWRSVAEHVSKSKRRRIIVNIGKLARETRRGEVVIVPGKVLGAGFIDHNLTVAALMFSATARRKIEGAGGSCLPLGDTALKFPKGSDVKILG